MDLRRGDEVLTTSQDYPRMLTTWDQRGRREGILIKQVSFPVPAPNMAYLVEMFADAITPRTKVIHVCHITNLTGQIFPVREIVQMARSRNIEVIVDGAHAYAQFPFKLQDLDCDYYGTSLHKWLLAPHGTGFLYVRKSKIEKLWPLMAAPASMNQNIRKFEEIGTHPAANHNAIAEALAFHDGIGGERKAARLRFLRDRWMTRLEGQRGIKLLTSKDPRMSCGLATFAIGDLDPNKVVEHLWKHRRILVTPIIHAEFKGIRVTPNVYTTLKEVDTFAESVEAILREGVNG
jgi:isopenicillin-N epimerase